MKKKMKSKLLAVVMSLTMVLTMIPIAGTAVHADDAEHNPRIGDTQVTEQNRTNNPEAFASNTNKSTVAYDLYVGGQQVTSGNMDNVMNDRKVSFTPAAGSEPAVLTLDNANIPVILLEGADKFAVGIYVGPGTDDAAPVGDLVIKLVGKNEIKPADAESYSPDGFALYGINRHDDPRAPRSLTICGYGEGGNGSLDIKIPNLQQDYVTGVWAGNSNKVCIEDAVVNAEVAARKRAVGVYAGPTTNLNVSAEKAAAEQTRLDVKVSSTEAIGVESGGITVKGCVDVNPAAIQNVFGISTNSNLLIKGGHVSVKTGDDTTEENIAISAGSVKLEGGRVSAHAGKGAVESLGMDASSIDVSNDFFENGGSIQVCGNTAAFAKHSMYIKDIWSAACIAHGAIVNKDAKVAGASEWDGDTSLYEYKFAHFPGKITLTFHWSSIDDESIDTPDPIVFRNILPGQTVEEVVEANNMQLYTPFFEADNYFEYAKVYKPIKDYANYHEVQNESPVGADVIMSSTDIYCLMFKYIDKVTAAVAPPVCGIETETPESPNYPGWDYFSQTNRPDVTLPDGAPYLAPSSVDSPWPLAFWTDPGFKTPFIGVFEGGREYNLELMLTPKIGYWFFRKPEVEVKGAEILDAWAVDDFYIKAKTTAVHDWGEAVYTWSKDLNSCKAAHTCKVAKCGFEENETATAANGKITSEVTKKPTCTTGGETIHTAAFTKDGLTTQSKKVNTSATGHSWDAGKVTKKATEKQTGAKTYTCKACKATKTETIPKLKPVPTPDPPMPSPKVSKQPSVKIKAGKKSMTLGWIRIKDADGYDIFFARCNHSHKKIVCRKVKNIKGNNIFTWKKSGLKKGAAYKSYVKAYVYKDGKKKYVYKSPIMHAYTGNGNKKYTNAKSVSIKNVKKGKLTLKKGKTFKIKAKVKKVKKNKKLFPKNHVPTLRYMTSDKKIATVSSKGKIKAVAKGKCCIYAYAHNGVSRSIKVTVK